MGVSEGGTKLNRNKMDWWRLNSIGGMMKVKFELRGICEGFKEI